MKRLLPFRPACLLLWVLLIAGSFQQSKAQPLSPQWRKTFKSQGLAQFTHLAYDRKANLYAAGFFHGSLEYESLILTEPQGRQATKFLLKFDPKGKLIWGKKLPFLNEGYLTDLQIDFEDNPVLLGQTYWEAPMPLDTVSERKAGQRPILAKFTTEGNLWWSRADSGRGWHAYRPSLVLDPYGRITVIDHLYSGTLRLGNRTLQADSAAGGAIYIAQFSPIGTPYPIRTAPAGTPANWAVAADREGNIFLAAPKHAEGTQLATEATAAGTAPSLFLCKFDHNANLLWQKTHNQPIADGIPALVCDLNGALWVADQTGGAAENPCLPGLGQQAGVGHFLLARFDSLGNRQWSTEKTPWTADGRRFDLTLSTDPQGRLLLAASPFQCQTRPLPQKTFPGPSLLFRYDYDGTPTRLFEDAAYATVTTLRGHKTGRTAIAGLTPPPMPWKPDPQRPFDNPPPSARPQAYILALQPDAQELKPRMSRTPLTPGKK